MQTVRHINPLGHVDMPYLRDVHGNPRRGPAVITDGGVVGDHRHGQPTEGGSGCLVPGELLEVEDDVAGVLLAQVINFELVSLSNLTVPDLEAYAESRGIDLGEASKKADVVKVIADEQAARWDARHEPVDPDDDPDNPDAAGDPGTDQQEG